MDVFLESVVLFLWTKQIDKYKKILNNFSSKKKGFQPPKSTKKYSFENNGYNAYLKKAKCRKLLLFTKNTQIYLLFKVSDVSKMKSYFTDLTYINYRPELYHFPIRKNW